jgi:membrane dipeptidase
VTAKLHADTIFVDATAPLAPFGAVPVCASPQEIAEVYESAQTTWAIFTIVDDFPNSIEQTVRLLGLNRRFFQTQPDRYVMVETEEDVLRAKRERKLAVAFAFQGSNALMGELALVEIYRRLGVVQMLLAYNCANLAADGCHERRNAGLTDFGRALIKEMNRVGMIVDVSHVGERSCLEALELTCCPAVFSHSTPKHFVAHDRNVTDEQIRACARTDGVIALAGLGLFMDAEEGKATTSRFVETVEYVCALVGPRHAAIGLDYVADPAAVIRYLRNHAALYGGGGQYESISEVSGISPTSLPEIAEELLRRNYAEEDVRGILGENYLRVFEANVRRS